MTSDNETIEGGMEAQLIALYGQRERLAREIGTADPVEIVRMIRSLEEQLEALYRQGASPDAEPPVDR